MAFKIDDYVSKFPAELQEKAGACANAADLIQLAMENDLELPPEALSAVAGGCGHEHNWYMVVQTQEWWNNCANPVYVWEQQKCSCGEQRFVVKVRYPGQYVQDIHVITQEQYMTSWRPPLITTNTASVSSS